MKRSLSRDFVIYFLSSVSGLLLKGKFNAFVYDVRMFYQWEKYKRTGQNTLAFHIPWMAFEVIRFLDKFLEKNMQVFEYGSGGSTLFFSDRVKAVYSVEHDARWFHEVQQAISAKGVSGVHHQLILPERLEIEQDDTCSDPDLYLSCMGAYAGLRFQDYVQTIDQHRDAYFDIVIVDGRARPSCIKHAIPKIKQGGVLVIDNADREYYLKPFPELYDHSKWEERSFTGHTPFGLTSVLYTTKLFIKK